MKYLPVCIRIAVLVSYIAMCDFWNSVLNFSAKLGFWLYNVIKKVTFLLCVVLLFCPMLLVMGIKCYSLKK